MRIALIALSSLALGAGGGAATPKPAEGETAIPFIASLSSVEWKAASDDSLYVRGGNGRWYFVRTMNRCPRLLSSLGLGFQTSAGGQLDRHGAILVDGVRCPVESVTRSDPPPRKKRKG
jgi:hypothetical protein